MTKSLSPIPIIVRRSEPSDPERATRRAVGVRTVDGAEIEAGQVIVSAAAVHSPAILLRSAVGVDDSLAVGCPTTVTSCGFVTPFAE
jgi:choline dehydrogenase-like flavoprotein